jgi:hypothetical protein
VCDDDFKGLGEKNVGMFVSEVVEDDVRDEWVSGVLLRRF